MAGSLPGRIPHVPPTDRASEDDVSPIIELTARLLGWRQGRRAGGRGEWLLVIDKPAGLVVPSGAGVRSGTLVHALLHHHPEIRRSGRCGGGPGIRAPARPRHSASWWWRRAPRAYRVLVEAIRAGCATDLPRAGVGRAGVDQRLDRRAVSAAIRGSASAWGGDSRRENRGHPRWTCSSDSASPRGSSSPWSRVERIKIRVHLLSHFGHPVIGDPLYGGRGKSS